MGEVVPARTSLTLHPPSPPTVHQLSRLALYELTTALKSEEEVEVLSSDKNSDIPWI